MCYVIMVNVKLFNLPTQSTLVLLSCLHCYHIFRCDAIITLEISCRRMYLQVCLYSYILKWLDTAHHEDI
jgi:hypothetical protein